MDANEYLETLVADSYKRELDQEENVVRSLPFAAAALAVVSTIMVVIRAMFRPGLLDFIRPRYGYS
jgi:hypothetical protein